MRTQVGPVNLTDVHHRYNWIRTQVWLVSNTDTTCIEPTDTNGFEPRYGFIPVRYRTQARLVSNPGTTCIEPSYGRYWTQKRLASNLGVVLSLPGIEPSHDRYLAWTPINLHNFGGPTGDAGLGGRHWGSGPSSTRYTIQQRLQEFFCFFFKQIHYSNHYCEYKAKS